MKNLPKNKIIGISVAAAILIGTGVSAGKIVTDATYEGGVVSSETAIITPHKQFGFGGWNLENVIVKIVNILDFSTALPGYTFNETTGFYTPMALNQSFESEIYSTDGSNEIRGLLHGKNWPKGEPAGIKIINGDLAAAKNGNPTNCIMNTSYLEDYYLDSTDPRPTICSSPFQTHKRFKVNMQPTMVAGTSGGQYGKPFDMVFNLDPADTSTGVTRYQVFQKINNYTGVRLDGYKVEVLDENGSVNPNLTLSFQDETYTTDLFDIEQRANFSNGLWGPIDDQEHFLTTGFFDDVRATYPVPPTTGRTSNTIAYFGDLVGANYQEMFGNWITRAWAPYGVYYDFDNDPTTDADVVAFYGQPPASETGGVLQPVGWYKGQKDNWAAVTDADIANYTGALYSIDVIEDTLNLGINYIVDIANNAAIGSTFTIRITPHVSTDQNVPAYVSATAPVLVYTLQKGALSITPAPTFLIGNTLQVSVLDAGLNSDTTTKQSFSLTVTTSKGETETVTLTETGSDTGVFTGTLATVAGATAGTNNDGTVSVEIGTTVSVTYTDTDSDGAGTDAILSASTAAAALPTDPVIVPTSDGGSGGFDAYDNLSLLAMIFGFLGIGAFIARRKLAKKA